MDTLVLIVTAIVAGAALGAKGVADKAVRDAYDGLKTLIVRKFGDVADVEDAIARVEANPDSKGRQITLLEDFQTAGVDQDPQVLKKAKAVHRACKKAGAQEANYYNAVLEGSGAIAQGGSAAAGAGGIAVLGNVQGPIVKGSRNIVGNVHGDVDMSEGKRLRSGKNITNTENARGITIGDQSQQGKGAALNPAAEQEILREQLQAQKLLFATYRKQLILASGGEAARLQVLIQQTEEEIRRLELGLDDLQTGA